jgi:dienelactone hydrolase
MKYLLIVALWFVGLPANEVRFYSEGIQCYGKLYLPKDFSPQSKAPAVVLAPDSGETAKSIENYAAYFAERGLVAMVIDYRGWGRSGGYLETVDDVQSDDRLRFSQMTTKVRIRRKRILPQQQILDIRNALYYLQGEPGVDRNRVGVWGAGLAGGHAIVLAATDARIKAVVAQSPSLAGKDVPRRAYAHSGELLAAEQKRARTGQILSSTETRLALAEYHPYWYLDQIPEKTALLMIASANGDANAIAASKLLKGPSSIAGIPVTVFEKAASAAADWFLKHL